MLSVYNALRLELFDITRRDFTFRPRAPLTADEILFHRWEGIEGAVVMELRPLEIIFSIEPKAGGRRVLRLPIVEEADLLRVLSEQNQGAIAL